MKKPRVVVLIFVMILIIVAFWLFSFDKQEELRSPFEVSVQAPSGKEVISCWMSDRNDYFVFLPAYADLTDVQIHISIPGDIRIDDIKIQEGMYCDAFELNTPYQISIKSWPNKTAREVTFVKSENVATMFIDTKSGDTEILNSNKEYKEEATIRTYLVDGSLDYSGRLTSISGRGNATWKDYDKKPYSIEVAEAASLLDMGSASKWVLLANASDPSNMRNKLGLDLSKKVGLSYSSDSKWVDLYLNGEYIGLYLLCEKNEVHAERVAISEEGSFLVSVELETRLKSQDIAHIVTDAKQALRIHHPSNISDAEKEALGSFWQSVENALLSEGGIDPQTGKSWLDLIDLDSWVQKYLIEEILGNWDACYISQFFYCDGYQHGAKVYAGPAWDYDRTLGNTSWQFQYTNALNAQRFTVKGEYDTPWFHELYQREEFYDRVVCVYQETFIPILEQLVDNTLEEYANHIQAAHDMDQLRWDMNNDLEDEIEYIGEFISQRMVFLSDIWVNGEDYCLVQANPGFNQFYANIAVKSGERLEDLRELTNSETSKFLGWYYADTDEPFDSTLPIYEDVALYAKWHGIPSWWKNQLLDVVPVMILAVMICVVFFIDVRRNRKSAEKKRKKGK